MEITNKAEFVGNSMDQGRAERIATAMDAANAEGGADGGSSTASKTSEPTRAQVIREAAKAMNEAAVEDAAEEAGDESDDAIAPAVKPRPKRADEPEHEETLDPRELVAERRKLRESNAKHARRLEADYQGKLQNLQQHAQRLQPLLEAAEAIESGDGDALARALGRFRGDEKITDFKSLSRELEMRAYAPGYRELRTLKAQARQREQTEQQQRQAWQHQQQQHQRAAEEQQWLSNLANELNTDEDAAVADVLNADPQFANHVFAEQRRNHSQHGEIPPARKAATSVLAGLYKNWARWGEYFERNAGSAWLAEVKRAARTDAGTPKRPAAPKPAPTTRAANPKQPPAPKQPQRLSASQQSSARRADLIKQHTLEMHKARKDPDYGW